MAPVTSASESSDNRGKVESFILRDVREMEGIQSSLPTHLADVILTDSHNPLVLKHQLSVLHEEFSTVAEGPMREDELLQILVELEFDYARAVSSCKRKDRKRVSAVIGDFAYGAVNEDRETEDDPVILSAVRRAEVVEKLVQQVGIQIKN